ncbi:MAG TPA: secondary thiamine-phosphate synthase enzyme YjbQ [Myxococcaceae bacterium]
MDPQSHTVTVSTRGRGLHDFTREVTDFVQRLKVSAPCPRTGVVHCFIRHTSASLVIQENADPEVLADLERFFARLVPDGDRLFHHTAEGPDDMPSHVRSALTQTSLSIPVAEGDLALGTWQAIYLYEHRIRAHRREVVLLYLGR